MREYDETTLKIAERVLKRSDEIIRQRQEQADKSDKSDKEQNITYDASVVEQGQSKTPKIRHLYAALAFCAGIVLCLGLMRFIKYTQELHPGPDDNDPASTSETTAESENTTADITDIIENESDITTVSSAVVVTETVSDTMASSPVTAAGITDKDNKEPSAETQAPVHADDNKERPENNVTEAEKTVTEATTREPEIIATEAETTTVTTAKPVLEPTMCGDVNGDNMVDIEDPAIIINYVNNYSGTEWTEFYKKQKGLDPDFAEQALANADAYRPSDKREITTEDAEAIMGYINGDYPNLPIDSL